MHEEGFKRALTNALNAYGKKANILKLAHSGMNGIIVIGSGIEHLRIRFKGNDTAGSFSRTHHLHLLDNLIL